MPWLDKPAAAQLKCANDLLLMLEAIDDQGAITKEGRRMARCGCPFMICAYD